jgi:hypothetical protein
MDKHQEDVFFLPNSDLLPLSAGPKRKMLVEIEVSADFERRLDNQWEVEREIHADRWSWRWADELADARFVRVWTNGTGRIEKISDVVALNDLAEQYGVERAAVIFSDLLLGKAGCASAGRSSIASFMIEYRGPRIK